MKTRCSHPLLLCLVLVAAGSAARPAFAAFSTTAQPDAAYVAATTLLPIAGANWATVNAVTDGTVTAAFSPTVAKRLLGSGWGTWGAPPDTESNAPGLPLAYTLGATTLTVTLDHGVSAFGLEAEPNPFGLYDFQADFYHGTTLLGSIARSISGSAGARLLAGSVSGGDPLIDRVVVQCATDFAIAQVRYAPGPSLGFTVQPASTTVMGALAPVAVTAYDRDGNVDTAATAPVTLFLSSSPSGAPCLYGTKTATPVNGVATFSDLRVSRAGRGYRLGASAAGFNGAISDAFHIVAPGPAAVRFATQPAGGTAGAAMPPFEVEVLDALGRRVTTGTFVVRLALYNNPARAGLSGTTTMSTVNGVATFSNIAVSRAVTGCTLAAMAARLTGTVSTPFTITP